MNLIILDAAKRELSESRKWYNEQQSGLGDRFADAVEAAVDDLLRDPTSWPIVEDEMRRRPVRLFPYGILFSVDGNNVIVIAVMDQRRRPRDWKDRRQD